MNDQVPIAAAFRDSSEQAKLRAFINVYRKRALPLQAEGNLLGEMALLEELSGIFPGSAAVRSIASQQIGTFLSFLGQHTEATAIFDSFGAAITDSASATGLLRHERVDAIAAIVAVADTTRALFINEAHHIPQHRVLTLRLLEQLRRKGFTHFAAETFAESDTGLNTRPYPVRTSGYYTNEPLFGEVVRRARQLGYTLVAYEAAGTPTMDREMDQATNLVARTFARDSNARVIVHAGYDHINESGQLAGVPTMAIRFRELASIDPVTVDQVAMTEHSDTIHENNAYKLMSRQIDGDAPIMLRMEGNRWWSARPGTHDITIIHPRTRLRAGRPSWLWSAGHRFPLPVPATVCRKARPCVIEARRIEESANAVPVDRVLVDDSDGSPMLLLTSGRYSIEARNRHGRVISRTMANVGI